MNNKQIEHMAHRFLNWKLPTNFNPDGGISFEPLGSKGTAYEFKREPSGTNLLSFTQAKEMVLYMVGELPTESVTAGDAAHQGSNSSQSKDVDTQASYDRVAAIVWAWAHREVRDLDRWEQIEADLVVLQNALVQNGSAEDALGYFSKNVDGRTTLEIFQSMAEAMEKADKACVQGNGIMQETWYNIAKCEMMDLCREHNKVIEAALAALAAAEASDGRIPD